MMAPMAELVTWTEVAFRFDQARNSWIGTVDSAGAPHAVPIWTAGVDGAIYIFGERRSAKFRNLVTNPNIVLHLESGDEVVIVRGTASDVGAPGDVPAVVAAFAAKYTEPDDEQWLPHVDPSVDVVARIEPAMALLWSSDDFFASKRRWIAEPST
jgi:nitroimidazol reductase NimA-like FMN-containing flavoprotein (pyridoxamine 5'-phosphate oxidase superfamily)